MKNKSGKPSERLWINVCNLWYGIPGESVMKLYDEMSSRVEVWSTVNGGFTMY